MKTNKWSARLGAAALGLFLVAGAAPAAQALTVNAFVVRQSCLNRDAVQVTLSATVQPAQQVRYRWDFNNDGVFDTTASTNPTVVHNYPDEKRVTARVVAITSTGTRAFDTVTFTTIRCGGGGGGGHDG